MSSEVQLAQIRALLAVASHGSYVRAAEELSYSEPAVYLQIKALERNLGVRLVRRQRKQVVLTPEGEQMLRPALEVLEAASAVATAARTFKGRVVVGAGPNSAVAILMPLVATFEAEHPAAEIELRAHDADGLARGAADGSLDVAVGDVTRAGLRSERSSANRLVVVPWTRDAWCVVGRTVPESRSPNVSDGPPRVFHYRRHVLDEPEALTYLHAELGQSVDVIELDSLELVRGAILNGLGYGVLPRSALGTMGPGFAVRAPLGPYGQLVLRLVHRRPRQLSPQTRAFIAHLVCHRHTAVPPAGHENQQFGSP